MEVLDTSIANVALPHIAGDLGASNDESTWVLTSYLVSNAIVLPISGWFVSMLGRKRFFMICILLFTLSFPALRRSLEPRLSAGRQNHSRRRRRRLATDGPGDPRRQLPSRKNAASPSPSTVFTAIVAPSIGPTLGGWITDNYSWRWIFYINLPVGLIALYLVYKLIEDPAYISRNIGKIPPRGLHRLRLACGWRRARCKSCWTRGKKTTGSAHASSRRWPSPRLSAS